MAHAPYYATVYLIWTPNNNKVYNYIEINKGLKDYVRTKEGIPEDLKNLFLGRTGPERPFSGAEERSAIQTGRGRSIEKAGL